MSGTDFGQGPGFVPELLELLDEGVVLHAPDGSVFTCNEAAERILGIPSLKLAGCRDLFSSLEAVGEDGERFTPESEPALQSLRTGVRCDQRRIRIRRPDGEVAWLQVKTVPILEPRRSGGQVGSAIGGALTVLRDSSDQVLIEQRLREEVPEDAFGQLAGSVAHDFNHFLTVIAGYNDIILGSMTPDDPMREHAEHMRVAASGAATLTRELMDFSRRQRRAAGAMDLTLTITEMQPLLVRLLGPRIRIRLELDRDNVWVRANPAQLERVIFNLALNARDAMRGRGELRLATRPVTIDEAFVAAHPGAQPGAFVRMTVADNGAGMEAGTRRRAFEPFFTTKPPEQGTGLGLATVWGIVKQFGGYIEVESEPGEGAVFRIDLPALSGEGKRQQQPRSAGMTAGSAAGTGFSPD